MVQVPPEAILKEQHQSKALLIKFAWLMLSGLCLLFISAMQWDDTIRSAYILGKFGVATWLFAGFGLLATGIVWLRAKDANAGLQAGIALAILGFVWLLFAVFSWIHTRNNLMFVDVSVAVLTLAYLVILSCRVPQEKWMKGLAIADGLAWCGSGLLLLLAAISWVSSANRLSWVTTIPLSVIAIITSICCFLASWKLRETNATEVPDRDDEKAASQARSVSKGKSPLNYIEVETKLIAILALVCCGVAILSSSRIPLFSGPTVVAALLGFASALMAIKIRTDPIFKDRVKVFSSPVGTQYIYPEQILLTDEVLEELQAFKDLDLEIVARRNTMNTK